MRAYFNRFSMPAIRLTSKDLVRLCSIESLMEKELLSDRDILPVLEPGSEPEIFGYRFHTPKSERLPKATKPPPPSIRNGVLVFSPWHPRLRGHICCSRIYCFSAQGMQAGFPSTSRIRDSMTSSPQNAHGADFLISAGFGSGT